MNRDRKMTVRQRNKIADMGKIFYIMGKSASGKDRIYSLLAAHKELNLKTLVLYTPYQGRGTGWEELLLCR